MSKTKKVTHRCKAATTGIETRVHDDAERLVEFLMETEGKTTSNINGLCVKLGWLKGNGSIRETDRGRFQAARNHVKDAVGNDGEPCTGYRLHYMSGKQDGMLVLIDPEAGLMTLAEGAIARLAGWLQREKQHQTENAREMETLERLAQQANKTGDTFGHKVCLKASIDIEEFGTVRPKTMAEMQVWVDSLNK